MLFRTFLKTLGRQLYLKLTKFTRRSSGPKSFFRKFAAGSEFLKDMSAYNWDVIKRCRRCIKTLAADKALAVLVYGEKDIIEVLRDLRFETPVKMRILRERYEADQKFGWETVPVEMSVSSNEKIIVASIINTEERMRRLRELGVVNERIVFLT